ncbi:exopolysaccharide biosynthesis protein [Falsihalocynthiibacter sp. BN13B15]|uniref:exopolysaccharide biosynthesis protein n=1 Tax=Falsihalocynthiibacter sp. BN13B15 TaxID=3240871 RepID=UPI00350F8A55
MRRARNRFCSAYPRVGEQSQSIGYVTLGEAIDRASTRMHGVAIFLMALPECIPLPIPSFGAILGVPLIAVSAHLAIYGERGDLPASARNIKIPHEVIAVMSRYMIRPLRSVERVSRNRLSVLGRRERIIGALCLWCQTNSNSSQLGQTPCPFMPHKGRATQSVRRFGWP